MNELHTVAEAATILKVLRFSDHDITAIMQAGARQPVTTRVPRQRRPRWQDK
jgi:hypothetical protein